jgi:hypothetical protein
MVGSFIMPILCCTSFCCLRYRPVVYIGSKCRASSRNVTYTKYMARQIVVDNDRIKLSDGTTLLLRTWDEISLMNC